MEVGIIGNGYHSKRIQKILKKIKINFFIYKKLKDPAKNTLELNKLKKFKIIFIISPNNTHFYYLNLLKKNRYLFCEKPPVSNLKELRKLKKFNKYNIYFNFNKRFSHLSLLLGNIKKYKLGQLIYANFIMSHGLAQTRKYIGSWRSKIKLAKKGVFEIVSIHDIDLVNYLYKIKKIKTNSLENFSEIGSSYDTSNIQIELNNKAIVNIFSTYNSSLHDNAILMFENGFVEKNNNEITINGPTKTFNKKGFFIKPPKILSNKISSIKDYELSLCKSVNYFIKHCKSKIKFPRINFDCSITTNEIILRNHKN